MRGASQAEAIAAATAAAEGAIAARFDSLRPNLDEFGRDLNLAERQAAEKRAAVRRSRREEELSMKNLGEEDDVEDAVEVELFYKGLEDATEAASQVMRDAGADFSSIPPIKARSEEWKRRFPRAYKDAYMPRVGPPALRAVCPARASFLVAPLCGDSDLAGVRGGTRDRCHALVLGSVRLRDGGWR